MRGDSETRVEPCQFGDRAFEFAECGVVTTEPFHGRRQIDARAGRLEGRSALVEAVDSIFEVAACAIGIAFP